MIAILHYHAVLHQEGGRNLGMYLQVGPAAFFGIDLAHLPRLSARGMQCAIGMHGQLGLCQWPAAVFEIDLAHLPQCSAHRFYWEVAYRIWYGGQLLQANLVTCLVELLTPIHRARHRTDSDESDELLMRVSHRMLCDQVYVVRIHTRAWHVVRHADIHEWHQVHAESQGFSCVAAAPVYTRLAVHTVLHVQWSVTSSTSGYVYCRFTPLHRARHCTASRPPCM
jgi:hypothetical protein